MRRIIIILVFLIILPVRASTYYSDYSSYSDWSINKEISSDIKDVEIERRYLYYHEHIEGDYYIEGENPNNYPLVDKNNYIKDTINNVETYDVKPNQEVESKTLYYYKYVNPIRYIVLSDVYGSNGQLNISEIRILARNTEVMYKVNCTNCSSSIESKLQDGNDTDNNYIVNGNNMIIDLNAYLGPEEFMMFIYFNNEDTIKFKISIRYDSNGDDFLSRNYDIKISNNFLKCDYNDLELDNPSWTEELVTDNKIESTKIMNVREVTSYKVINTYYYYYKIFKEYSQVNTDYYNKVDYDKYEDYYRYRTRDKVVIADNILIDNKQKLEDFILESTVDVSVDPIDYSKNGTYNINYITPFKVINRDVVIDKYENKYNDLLATIDDYIDRINKLNEELNKEKVNGELVIKYVEEINKYKEDIELKSKELEEINTNLDKYIKEVNTNLELIDNLNKELEKYKNKDELESYNKYIEELNNYSLEIEKYKVDIVNYQNQIEDKEKENNRIKREYENEIINLKMSDNDKEVITKEIVKEGKCFCIPLIMLWLLVIILLIIMIIIGKKLKRKSSFVEDV